MCCDLKLRDAMCELLALDHRGDDLIQGIGVVQLFFRNVIVGSGLEQNLDDLIILTDGDADE